ncbi:hypothetical protein [Nitrospira sp. Nam74]
MQIKMRKTYALLQDPSPRYWSNRLHTFSFLTKTLACSLLVMQLGACVGPLRQRVVYQHGEIQVGLQTDLSTERASPPVTNVHPQDISSDDMRALLGSVEVSGWSGIIVGLFQEPRPFPVFTTAELDIIAAPIAQAFQQAAPKERVFFSIPGNRPPYPSEKEKTAGALFFRDQYLHMVLTDHYAFTPADPGGGEERDPRDTKGMKLWVAAPARAATVPKEQEPDWSAFEKVHISLKPKEVLASRRSPSAITQAPKPAVPPSSVQTVPGPPKTDEGRDRESNELRLQIRELTNANLDLRDLLKQQRTEIETLRQELDRLRKEIKPRSPQKPPNRTSPNSNTP